VPSPSIALKRGAPLRVRADAGTAEAAAQHVRDALQEAVEGLNARSPELSAASGLWGWQRRAVAGAFVALAAGVVLAPETTLVALLALMAFPFLCVVMLRVVALWQLNALPAPMPAPLADDAPLPLYTVLVPLYREAGVVAELLRSLRALDYPPAHLEVMLIVESVDSGTREALARATLDAHMQVIIVPDGAPRTKPRAIQYALQFARGDYVVVYDAEDAPEKDQLRRALAALKAGGERMGCLQAQLNIYNSEASWFTRQFAVEYTVLFDCILPALERLQLPVPLGGTSNHFPRAVLEAVGGWDPYNVTEDADLGIRLARRGWHVGVLSSTTWEEAPPTFRIWKGQRTRWLKGWMQTYFVHMRAPRRLWRELGARRFIGFQVLMGGMILSALVHPWFYLLIGFDLWQGRLLGVPEGVFGQWLLGIGVFNLIAGYVSAIALGTVAAARRGRLWLAVNALMMPAYWLAISFAAYRALWQLVWAPYFWEKTEHAGRGGAMLEPREAAADESQALGKEAQRGA
jgi:cellulose synthase/poly-beta-1,6-N-acetylglucosamine synthase-like glycosyltransferase